MVIKQEIDVQSVKTLEPGDYEAIFRVGVFGRTFTTPYKIEKMTITKVSTVGNQMTVNFTISNPLVTFSLKWYMWLIILFLAYFGFRAVLERLYLIKPLPLTPAALLTDGLTILIIITVIYILFLRKFLRTLIL